MKRQTNLRRMMAKVIFKKVKRTSDNGLWQVTGVRSIHSGHLSGWLTNTKTKVRYVWNIIDGKRVNYMRIPTDHSKGIPRYVDDIIYDLEREVMR